MARKVVAMESDSDESFNLRMAQSVGDLVSVTRESDSDRSLTLRIAQSVGDLVSLIWVS